MYGSQAPTYSQATRASRGKGAGGGGAAAALDAVRRDVAQAEATLQALRKENAAAREKVKAMEHAAQPRRESLAKRRAAADKGSLAVQSKVSDIKSAEKCLVDEQEGIHKRLAAIAKEASALHARQAATAAVMAPDCPPTPTKPQGASASAPNTRRPPPQSGVRKVWAEGTRAVLKEYRVSVEEGAATPAPSAAGDAAAAVPASTVNALSDAKAKGARYLDTTFASAVALRARFPSIPVVKGLKKLALTWKERGLAGRIRVAVGTPAIDIHPTPCEHRPAAVLRQVAADRSTAPPPRHVVRLLILVAGNEDTAHPLHRVCALVAKYTDAGVTRIVPYGGAVTEAADDPASEEAAMAEAKRLFKDTTGVALGDIPLIRFLEATTCTHGDDAPVHTTYYIADYTAERPRILRPNGLERRGDGLAVAPVLVSLHAIAEMAAAAAGSGKPANALPPAQVVDPLLAVAVEGVKQMIAVGTSKKLHAALNELVSVDVGKKRKRTDSMGRERGLFITESLRYDWVVPFSLLEAPPTVPGAPQTGVVTRDDVLRSLVLTAPDLTPERAHALLRGVGLHAAGSVRYHNALTVVEIAKVDTEGDLDDAVAPPAKVARTS